MSSASRYKRGERFGAIPVEVMESDAWAWLPQFARLAVLSLAACYTGKNNGGIELTDKRANELHMNETDKNMGLRLACEVGIIRKMVPARRRSGRGIPAKYALTWKPLDHFANLGFCATEKASNLWATAVIPNVVIKSRRDAQKHFGWKSQASDWQPPDQTLKGEHHVQPEKARIKESRASRKKNIQPTRVVPSELHVQPDENESDEIHNP